MKNKNPISQYEKRGLGLEHIAIAAKAKEMARKYEDKETNVGLKVKKVHFKNFTELCNWYMLQPSVQELSSYKRKISGCKHLVGYFGNHRINRIEGTEQEKYRAHRKQMGAKDGTVNVEIEILSAAYNMALKDKKIQFSDKPGRFVFRSSHNPRRMITEDEYQSLLKHAEQDLRDLISAAYESGMRSGELCKLTANRIHLNINHISGKIVDYIDLGIFDTKNRTRRTVPISPEFKEVLERRLQGLGADDLVFTRKDRKWRADRIALDLADLCQRAGVPYGDNTLNKKGERIGIVFHCFRHTRISKWVEAGFSDEIIRRASGHNNLKSYRTYIKLDPSAVMRLVQNKTVQNRNKNRANPLEIAM